MPGTTRILKDPWPYRSTTPGASDSFDIDGLQGVLRQLDEHARWVQATPPDAPTEGDLWSDMGAGILKTYSGGQWRLVGAAVKAGTPTDADFGAPPPDGTLVVDTTGSKLWARIGGTWKSATFA